MNIFIFLAGLLIYAGYGLPGLGYLAAATLLSYGAALLTGRFRWTMWLAVAAHGGMLVLLKLQPITGMELITAMGVSYFSLQLISYNVDVWKGKYPAEKNLYRFALYVTYLPHLFIGPIEQYPQFASALGQRQMNWDDLFQGGARALWGLFKKLVIAARLGVIIGAISADPETYRGGYALTAMLLYSLQLYSDFSGGMDLVLGISQMLGLKLSENFDRPYFSQSVQEFWRRWHMTLGSWLRSYIYIPLGGNRKGKVRKIGNTLVTFLVSGLWHGVHYLIWGLLNGIFVCFGTKLQTKWKTLNRIGTFLLISLLWCFFIWPDTQTALTMVASVFTDLGYGSLFSTLGTMGLALGDWIVLAGALMLLWGHDWFREPLWARFNRSCPAVRTAVICSLALLVLLFGMYGMGFQAEGFIYSKF
jgi:D-alanyl-lipoteichoic acid acyltransferase DltB (MBOAT superfamily)